MENKLEKIILEYGYRNQLKKLSEEVFEFQEAVLDYTGELKYDTCLLKHKHIEEEYADVMVLMEQFKMWFGLDIENINKIMEDKINRQIERIDSNGDRK